MKWRIENKAADSCQPKKTKCSRASFTIRWTPELAAARERARNLCDDLNATREQDQDLRRSILRQLFGQGGDSVGMQPPFYCDYGSNILLGERVFFNFNCVVLDVCPVRIGDFTLLGPAVQIYTWMPNSAARRNLPSQSRSARTSGSAAGPSSVPA